MAYSCPKCNAVFNEPQKFCQNCGFQFGQSPSPTQQSSSGCGSAILWLIGIGAALFLILFIISYIRIENEAPKDSLKRNAIYAARDLMEQRLKSPSSASFQSTSEAQYQTFEENGKQLYVVTSYVDSENSFGAKIRTNFAITMSKSGTTWYLEDIYTW